VPNKNQNNSNPQLANLKHELDVTVSKWVYKCTMMLIVELCAILEEREREKYHQGIKV